MQVFKAFFKLLNKHKSAIFVYTGIFFAITMLMTSSGQSTEKKQYSQVELTIGVENSDKGELGAALVDYLSTHNKIKELPKEKEELIDAMYYRKMEYVLKIPKDFTEKFLAGERENVLESTVVPGSNTNFLTEAEMNQFLVNLGMYLDSGFDTKEAIEHTMKDVKKDSQVSLLDASDSQEKPRAAFYFQYLSYIFVTIMVMCLGAILLIFGKKEIDDRMKCSSTSFTKRNLQMVLGSILLALMIYGFFMIAAWVLFADYMNSVKGVLSALNALVYMILCLSLTFFISRVAGNGEESGGKLDLIANIVGLAFSFLGGVFVPMEVMNETVVQVAKFIPSYWYNNANDKIWKITSFADAGDIYKNYLIMGIFAVAILAVAMVINKVKARRS